MKKRNLLVLSFTTLMATTALAGCGKVVEEDVDESKTQLRVKYTNGGFGSVWLDTLIEEFTQEFAETSFEDGKKGVQVIKEYDKRNVSHENMRGNSNHVFIQEDTDYYTYISKGVLKDITDVVTDYAIKDKNSKETDRKIEDKIDDAYKEFYKYDNKYYAIPLFETNVGLQYNVQVFEKYGLYFKKGASADNFTASDYSDMEKIYDLFVTEDEEKSYGPDGRTGVENGIDYTIDDGLPATYKDMKALIIMMKNSGVTPFIWNTTCTNYLTSLINDAWATNEGPEQFKLNFYQEGNATNLVRMSGSNIQKDSNGNALVETVNVTNDKSYELQRQKGKLQSLELAQLLVGDSKNDKNYYSESWSTSYSDAQEYFINPQNHKNIGEIAFLVEGGWWFREATDRFTPGTQQTAKFSPFVLPKARKEQIGTPNVRVSDRRSLMFISNYCPDANLEVAKKFLSFLQTDHALETYTLYTHGQRAMKYDISEETYNKMSYYGKASWNISRKSDTVTIPWLPLSTYAKEHVTELDYAVYGYAVDAGDGNPVMYFNNAMQKDTPKTAEEYFAQIYNFKKK